MLSFFAIFSKQDKIMPDFDDYLLVSEYPDKPVERMVVAFRGWPDAGDAATATLNYMLTTFQAEKFAEIDPEEFFNFAQESPVLPAARTARDICNGRPMSSTSGRGTRILRRLCSTWARNRTCVGARFRPWSPPWRVAAASNRWCTSARCWTPCRTHPRDQVHRDIHQPQHPGEF